MQGFAREGDTDGCNESKVLNVVYCDLQVVELN